MRTTEKLWIAFWALFLVGIVALSYVLPGHADTGHEGAIRIERGSYAQTRKITVSTTAVTALWAGNVKRPDSLCYNWSQDTILVGTSSVRADLYNVGFVWVASSTLHIDGSYTGALNGTCDGPNRTCEVRCLDLLVQ